MVGRTDKTYFIGSFQLPHNKINLVQNMNINSLNENLVVILNTGFHLQRNAYKKYIFSLSQELLSNGASNLPVEMIHKIHRSIKDKCRQKAKRWSILNHFVVK